MNNSNKIILNTGITFLSLILRMIISLFSVRFVLQALGEVDYGIYIIVGGIVAMLDILNSNMSNTSMRYLAYSLGNKNKDDILVTFNTTVFIHYFIGFISIVLLEVGGLLMFEYIVNIPAERMGDARIIYQFMVATTFINIIAVPYDAVTNAHEHIWALSVFDIFSSSLVLILSLLLLFFDGNRLIFYGICLLLIQILMRIIKVWYAKHNFCECRKLERKFVDRNRIKGIVSFTGWNLFGSITSLCMTQFRSLILNSFFGVRLNAAEGVSRQVTSPLNMIVTSMTRAINPQIMKSEGGENHVRMKFLVMMGAKYSTFLFAMFGIPVLLELPFILKLWLDSVPEYAAIFCQLTIVGMLMEKFTFQINHAISAVGNIKNYQIIGGVSSFVYLPFAFWLFKIGYPPVTIYILSLANNILFAIIRLYFGRKVAGINSWEYIKVAILPVLWPILLAFGFSLFFYIVIPEGIFNMIVVTTLFIISFVVLFWFVGMTNEEAELWKNLYMRLKTKFVRINK